LIIQLPGCQGSGRITTIPQCTYTFTTIHIYAFCSMGKPIHGPQRALAEVGCMSVLKLWHWVQIYTSKLNVFAAAKWWCYYLTIKMAFLNLLLFCRRLWRCNAVLGGVGKMNGMGGEESSPCCLLCMNMEYSYCSCCRIPIQYSCWREIWCTCQEALSLFHHRCSWEHPWPTGETVFPERYW